MNDRKDRAWIPGVSPTDPEPDINDAPLSCPPTDLEVLIQRARADTNLRLDLMEAKNQDYASVDDVLENFRRNADDLGISIPTAILAMASKHWRALCKWSQDKELETTNFDEIVGDIHNFLDILKHWKEKSENIVKVDASDDPLRQWKVKVSDDDDPYIHRGRDA